MARTQIHLGRDEIELLDREAERTGASRSELIRRAVRKAYGPLSKAEKLEALRGSAGSWKDLGLTGAEYVAAIRSDSKARRRALRLE